ncbi:DUF4132 domain-containing protein, partial [Solirubrobacter taibaiensis]|nr:DUF4132 domain-containing protein [Solirubrobacter taibaiensis]
APPKGAAPAAPTEDAAPASASAGGAAPAASPASTAPSPDGPAPALRTGLALRPDEWAWASWRPLPDPPGPPRPFDRRAAAASMRRAKSIYYGSRWLWPEAPFEGALTPEEAGAWLTLTDGASREGATAAARRMATYDGAPPSRDDALRLAMFGSLPKAFALSALIDLLGPDDVAHWLLAPEPGFKDHYGRPYDDRVELAFGARAFLLPRLDPDARERFVDAIRTANQHPGNEGFNAAVRVLAAQAGLHDVVEDIIARNLREFGRTVAVLYGLPTPAAVEEALGRELHEDWQLTGWLAHTETSRLDVVAHMITSQTNKDEAEHLLRVFARSIHDPAAAPVMLELTRTSRAPAIARDWLTEHPLEATVGLARTLPGRARPETVEYLRTRKRVGDDVALALPHLDDASAARLRELVIDHEDEAGQELTRDQLPEELAQALAAIPRKALPGFLDLPALPPIVVAGEGRLDAEDSGAVLLACTKLTPDQPTSPALIAIARHVDAEAFAWALFEAWLGDGSPPKHRWALLANGPLGGDRSATKLAPLIRAWPGESQHARAVLGLGVLATIGTDTALMLLSGIAEKVKFKALQQRARDAMDEIAAAKGMTKAELEDRIVPDCGLDESGSRTFDIGGTTYAFALGPGMKPMLRDEATGKLRASPPKPSDEWKLLRKQVSDVAKIQSTRLEQAMVTQRRWTPEDFERFVVRHPLQRHLAKLLVWRSGDTTFRITDELDYADAADEPVALEGEIGLVHPLQLSEDERAAWGEQLADYEIVPPFPQLGRPVLDVEPSERKEVFLTRFDRRKVPASTLVRMLENASWQRGQPQDAGIFYLHAKAFPALGVTAVVEYDGIPVGIGYDWDDQAIERAYVVDDLVTPETLDFGSHWRKDRRLKWGDVDPIVRSEVLADIAAIVEKAR